MLFAPLIALAITFGFIAGQSPQSANPPATQNKASADQPPVDVLTYKIGPEYYAILDSESAIARPMAAENADHERMPNIPPSAREEQKQQLRRQLRQLGRIYSSSSSPEMRNAYGPDLFQLVIKNTSAKSIKAVEWDFLFPHCENDQAVDRYDVTTRVEIKPGGKKMLKSKLPSRAGRCDIPKVIGARTAEQERFLIKRIEYVDGSIWQRQ